MEFRKVKSAAVDECEADVKAAKAGAMAIVSYLFWPCSWLFSMS